MMSTTNLKQRYIPIMPAVMTTPREIKVEITSRCNLRCSYCYYFDNDAVDYHDVSTEEWLQFFEECGKANVMKIRLAGGEPFMRKDLRVLLDGIVRNHMRYSFLSNGRLINDDIAAYIAETGRCDSIQVSIDGSTSATHDSHRGAGTFEHAINGIRTLQRHNIPVEVRITIHQKNFHDIENTVRLLLDDLGLPFVGTNAATYIGSCSKDILMSVKQREYVMETLLRLSDEYGKERITASAGPLYDARAWREMEEARASGAPAFSRGGRLTACNCHSTNLSVRADGGYVTCSWLAHEELGRINQDSLVDIWQNSAGINKLRQRHTISLEEFEDCASCDYRPYCTGNCPGMSYPLTGSTEKPSPDGCLRQYLEGGGKIPGMTPENLNMQLKKSA